MDKRLSEKLESLRVMYQLAKLDIDDCAADPLEQFDLWLQNAIDSCCDEPNAFVLSTVRENTPHARVVLLKGFQNKKPLFYTNYLSDKGRDISVNSAIAMTFLWLPLQRQVRIEGKVSRVDASLSENYFHKRPRGSQLGAIASPQSQRMNSRQELEDLFKTTEDKLQHAPILPRPLHWGGYAVEPEYFEFWQGRENRLHDRICYLRLQSGWTKSRLAP